MRTIRISEEVWDEIAKRGKFGETPDDVLRRAFKIDQGHPRRSVSRSRYATDRMTARIEGDHLLVRFASGPSREFLLPDRHNKEEISILTYNAMAFAKTNDATEGQVNAVRKALTDAGFHITM